MPTERERSNSDSSLPRPASLALLESVLSHRAPWTTAWQGCGRRDGSWGLCAQLRRSSTVCVRRPGQPVRSGHSTIRATFMWDRSIMCLREVAQRAHEAPPPPADPPMAHSATCPAAGPPPLAPGTPRYLWNFCWNANACAGSLNFAMAFRCWGSICKL